MSLYQKKRKDITLLLNNGKDLIHLLLGVKDSSIKSPTTKLVI
jgi:hypothetical protein